MEVVRLAYQEHPVLCGPPRLVSDPFREDETLAEYFARHAIPVECVAVAINDCLVRPTDLGMIIPKHGDLITVRAVMQGGGGGGGSQPLAMVAMIAVSLAAAYVGQVWLGPALFEAMGVGTAAGWGAAASSVFAMGGNMGIAMLARSAPTRRSTAATSSNYQISGSSNRLRPYEPMPLLIGAMRMTPDLAAKTRTLYRKDADGDSVQQAVMAFQFGPVPMRLSYPRLGTTALSKFKGVELHEVDPTTWRLPDSVDPRNVDTIGVGEIKKSNGWVERETPDGTTAIELEFTGLYYWAYNNGGYGPEKVQLQLEYAASGTSDWLPVYASRRGAWRTTVTVLRVAYDYADDGANSVETVVSQTSTLSHWGDREALEAGETESLRDDENSNAYITRTVVAWDPDATAGGSASTVTIGGHRGVDPVVHTFWKSVPSGKYRVRVRKLTDEPTSSRLVQTVAWSQLRSWQRDSRVYPSQRRVGLCIRATELANGSLDVFTMWSQGRCVGWNGSRWAEFENENPAWWFLEMALGLRGRWVGGVWVQRRGGTAADGRLLYGAGLRWDQVELSVIREWGIWCREHDWKINAVHEEHTSAGELLDRIASVGRASVDWSTGKLGVVWDEAGLPYTVVAGMGNIKPKTFTIEYLKNPIIDEVVATYRDKDTGADKTVRVTRPGVTVPERTVSETLWGTGTELQAVRICNLMIASTVYRRRLMTWEMDYEHLAFRRGAVALLSHDLTQWGYSGRIVSGALGAGTVVLNLDRAVPVARGRVYHVALRAPGGELIAGTTVPTPTSGDMEALECVFRDAPDMPAPTWDYLWFFDALATPGKRVKIVSVKPDTRGHATITATDESEAYYLAEYRPGQVADTSTSLVFPRLENLRISEAPSSPTVYRVGIMWTLRDCVGADLRWRVRLAGAADFGEWETQRVVGGSKTLTLPRGCRIQVRAVPVPLAGLAGDNYGSIGASYVAA